jgi:hypothetical protein
MRPGVAAFGLLSLLAPAPAAAQAGVGGSWTLGGGATGSSSLPGGTPSYVSPSKPSGKSSDLEIGILYATSVGYGVGLGIWIDAEAGIEDPGIRFIPPSILGLAAPIGVYFLDQPPMPRGMPAAIAAGMAIGAGEGLGIASYQFVTADEDEAWGFKGLARSVSIGATLGGVGGYALAVTQEPSPKTSLFVSSGVLWGTTIGSMFGYGASEAGTGYGESNDGAALGGLIGYNVGLVGAAGLSFVLTPTWDQLGWMWGGAGIGAAASLPVFLFYAGEDTPPAKRGLIFMGTATTLGIAAGAVFASGSVDDLADRGPPQPAIARVTHVGPLIEPGAVGLSVGGVLF